ncbi:hypothetical protein HMPREF1861_02080 [Corynebacterium kroppenstedtii]|nr:hypothetical protein HMPREF1861_02080 [Corynebacterium kroppenstedtii]
MSIRVGASFSDRELLLAIQNRGKCRPGAISRHCRYRAGRCAGTEDGPENRL